MYCRSKIVEAINIKKTRLRSPGKFRTTFAQRGQVLVELRHGQRSVHDSHTFVDNLRVNIITFQVDEQIGKFSFLTTRSDFQ